MYVLCVFVCSCAAHHKDVPSFGGACFVKMAHLSARGAHVCLCFTFVCVCAYFTVVLTAKCASSVHVCVIKLTNV